MDFTITIKDERKLAGLAIARERHNKEPTPRKSYGSIVRRPFVSDAEYLQFIVDQACENYARMLDEPEQIIAAKDAVIAQKEDEMKNLRMRMSSLEWSAKN
jgi:hypothetical protein